VTPAAAAVRDPQPEATQQFKRILLASEGRQISSAAVSRAIELAAPGASVRVFTVARVHGVAFGLPSPGLLPTKAEWAEQRNIVTKTIGQLERKGIEADGHVLGTRNAAKKIVEEAVEHDCEAIVMSADPDRNRVVGNVLLTQEPQRVRRRAKVPVFLVVQEG
jgi:nucleotide-binding universal stress UspA family protein